jgi:hypothetical protein
MEFQNIWGEGYVQVPELPDLGIVEDSREVERLEDWLPEGRLLAWTGI